MFVKNFFIEIFRFLFVFVFSGALQGTIIDLSTSATKEDYLQELSKVIENISKKINDDLLKRVDNAIATLTNDVFPKLEPSSDDFGAPYNDPATNFGDIKDLANDAILNPLCDIAADCLGMSRESLVNE